MSTDHLRDKDLLSKQGPSNFDVFHRVSGGSRTSRNLSLSRASAEGQELLAQRNGKSVGDLMEEPFAGAKEKKSENERRMRQFFGVECGVGTRE